MMRTPRLGEAVRSARLAKGLSQAQLAKAIGVNKNTIGHLERGEYNTDAATVAKVEKALGIELSRRAIFQERVVLVAQDAAVAELWNEDAQVRYAAAIKVLNAFGYLGDGWSPDPSQRREQVEVRARSIPGVTEEQVQAALAVLT